MKNTLSWLIIPLLLAFMTGVCCGYGIQGCTRQYQALNEWETLQLAIIKTESDFNKLALGKKDDYGLYQITNIYVKDVNRILKDTVYNHTDAFNPKKAKAMFEAYQSYYNPEKDIVKATHLHNPSDKKYVARVMKNYEWIQRYEAIRQLIKQK